jgi:hypothetical protein
MSLQFLGFLEPNSKCTKRNKNGYVKNLAGILVTVSVFPK